MHITYKHRLSEADACGHWKTQCKIMRTGKYKPFMKDLFLSYHSFHCYTTQNTKCTGNRFPSIKHHRYLIYRSWAAKARLPMTIHLLAPPPPHLIRISNDHPWRGYTWIFSGTAHSYLKFTLIGTRYSAEQTKWWLENIN